MQDIKGYVLYRDDSMYIEKNQQRDLKWNFGI